MEVKRESEADLFAMMVDRGEAEALQLCREHNAQLLLIDDAKGRRLAEYLNIRVLGTLGILGLRMHRKDFLKAVTALQVHGFRFSDNVVQEILKSVKP